MLRASNSKTAMRPFETSQAAKSQIQTYDDAPENEGVQDNSLLRENSRDSHGLSMMLEGNRNSVVDHMLLSLDSMPNSSTPFATPATAAYSKFNSGNSDPPSSPEYVRRRSQTLSASRSSSYDLNVQDVYPSFANSSRRDTHNAQQLSSQSTKDLSRQFVRDEIGRSFDNLMQGRNHNQNNGIYGVSHGRQTDRNGSKSSTRTSLEQLRQDISTPPRSIGLGDRSGSVEYSQRSPSEQRVNPDSILSRGRPVPGGYWRQDAAPEPAVHAGPRRRTETAAEPTTGAQMHPPLPGYEAHDNSKPKRRSSIKSATSRLSRRGRADGEANSRNASAKDALAAPSPSAGYRKHGEVSGTANQTAPKEKTGFFRRVFGSSKNTSAPAQPSEETQVQTRPPTQSRQQSSAPHHPSDFNSDNDRPRTQASVKSRSSSSHLSGQMKAQSQPAPPDVPPVPVEHQTLNKKPSSFFRRRKKSVSDSKPPVTILQQHPRVKNMHGGADMMNPPQSPSISSLRKVMSSYLSDAQLEQEAQERLHNETSGRQGSASDITNGEAAYGYGHEEDHPTRSRGVFTSGHTPYEGATIRQVSSGSPHANEFPASGWASTAGEGQPQSLETQKFRAKLRKSRPSTGRLRDDESYMASSNLNEEKTLYRESPTHTPSYPYVEAERPKTSPTRPSFMADAKENIPPAISKYSSNMQKSSNGLSQLFPESSRARTPPALPYGSERTVEQVQPNFEPKTQVSARSNRIWIEDDSDEARPAQRVVSPLLLPVNSIPAGDGDEVSPLDPPSPPDEAEVFHSATSLPIVQVDGDEVLDDGDHNRNTSDDTTGTDSYLKATAAESVAIDTDAPQVEDRDRAAKIFAGDESFVPKARAAAWLGETSFVSARTRKAYMELFDWTGLSILNSFRELCLRLIVKAESQQLDRIIDAFSQRWCSCNSRHGFKAAGIFPVLM